MVGEYWFHRIEDKIDKLEKHIDKIASDTQGKSSQEFLRESHRIEEIQNILRKLHTIGGTGARNDFIRGWDEAINQAIRIIEVTTGVIMEVDE